MVIRDGDWTLFDADMKLGRYIWHMYDGEKDVYRIDYVVDNIIRDNASSRNEAPRGWKGDWHRIASIPLNLAYGEDIVTAHREGSRKFIDKWLSENSAWRTK